MSKKQPAGVAGTAVLEQPSTTKVEQPRPLPSEFKSVAVTAVVQARGPNTRPEIPKDSILELAASIKAQGLLQPIVVGEADANGLHTILAGRRRLAAVTHLGHVRINAIVLDGGAARAFEILITENLQRQEPDPFLEADVVAKMLARPNWTYHEVAAALGRTVGWVARRSKLGEITKEAREAIDEASEYRAFEWPIAWLEELALAPAERQRDIAEGEPMNLKELRRDVQQAMRSLGTASWPLEASDVGKGCAAISCKACTKHSATAPSLFPEEPELHELKTALCLDPECFALKRTAWTKHQVTEAKKETGGDVMLVHGVRGHDGAYVDDEEFGKGTKVEPAEAFAPAKKTDKGAKPALVIDGPKAGTTVYVKKATGSSSMAPKEPEFESNTGALKKPMSMPEKRKALDLRRARHMFTQFRAELEELSKSADRLRDFSGNDLLVMRLACAFHTGTGRDYYSNTTAGSRLKLADGTTPQVRARLLKDVIEFSISNQGAFSPYAANGNNANRAAQTVGVWLEITGAHGNSSLAARVEAAAIAIPEPRSWAEEKPAAKSTPAKAPAKASKSKSTKDAGKSLEKLEGELAALTSKVGAKTAIKVVRSLETKGAKRKAGK